MAEENFPQLELPPKHFEELQSLGRSAEEKIVNYSERGIERGRREAFKEAINERAQAVQSAQTAPTAKTAADEDAKRIKALDKSRHLQELINYTASHGPVKASMLARKIGNPYLEDELHDALISFHDELVRRGKLKEE